MKIQVFGCNHHTAPIGVRERLAFEESREGVPVALFDAVDTLFQLKG
jgi:hypothetical protein